MDNSEIFSVTVNILKKKKITTQPIHLIYFHNLNYWTTEKVCNAVQKCECKHFNLCKPDFVYHCVMKYVRLQF